MRVDPENRSPWHLLWAVPFGILLGITVGAVAFFAWCGPNQCGQTDPTRFVAESVAAFAVTGVGAALGGLIAYKAPSAAPVRARLTASSCVITVVLLLAVWYFQSFTA